MTDIDRRSRMISLRLSEEEYAALKAQYRTRGARNVSDLARLALQRLLEGSDPFHDGFAAKLADLDGRLNSLESQVSLIMERDKVLS